MDNECLFISVESRKGGVGKTTAAFNLARLLLNQQREVLFLDADITGTDAIECLRSPFWKDIGHAVRAQTGNKSSPANLLLMFERQFMAGHGVPHFTIAKDNVPEANLWCQPGKINVLGSQIYTHQQSSSDDKAKYICNPSVLFDELHAFWFIEFVQELCGAFIEEVRHALPDHHTAIVIDNSPGYVGIAPAIQEWLTNLGPDRGKFLTVASLDVQDLISCGHAVDNLHSLFMKKWETSRKFEQACCQEPQDQHFSLTPAERSFFLRLVESTSRSDSFSNKQVGTSDLSGDTLEFYHQRQRPNGNAYVDDISKYQGIVINRVPRSVKRGTFSYDTDNIFTILHSEDSKSLRSLLDRDSGDWTDHMVYYDEYIEYQFLQSMLSRRARRMSRKASHFEEAFMHFVERVPPLNPREPIYDFLRHGKRIPLEILDRLRKNMRSMQDRLTESLRFLDQYGFSHITRLIDSEWLPGSILQNVGVVMREILYDVDFPHIDFMPQGWDTGPIEPDAWMFLEQLPESAHELLNRQEIHAPREYIDQFLPSLTAVLALSLTSPWWHSPFAEKFTKLFAAVPVIQSLHFAKKSRKSERRSVQQFLANDTVTAKEAKKYPMRIPMRSHWSEHNLFPRFYAVCSTAQARLIDLPQDTDFLLAVIRELVHEEIKEAPIMPYVRGIAEKVIVQKIMPHDRGLQQVEKGFVSAQYMDEFAAVLEKVIMQWRGDNDIQP